ncbi:MAG: DUF4168 domain-containing protein [Brasilonema angustatum HA4187-MV1]|jgi:hypothetical protein|nr:DUF4168 domain-containing protein [Brasilonema angustatum HA4187-MV1]
MKRSYQNFFQVSLIPILAQSLFVGIVATASLVSSTLVLSSKTDAQAPQGINPGELRNYARAMLKMEPERQQAFDEIKKIMNAGDVPKIVCNDNNSLNGLPGKAKDIAVNYCQRYQKVVEDNGLSIDRYNTITTQVQGNEDLKRKMYNELLRQQKVPKSL